jgi:hypothetical protein
MRLAIALCLIGSAAGAQSLMTAEEFDAWSRGKTLDYSVDGQIYGSERYLPGRKTVDANAGGPCVDGVWYPEGDAICFVYAAYEGTHCWRYWREGGAVFAKPVTAAPEEPPQRVTVAESPLTCPGPDVGG